jgi:hypothetical protein
MIGGFAIVQAVAQGLGLIAGFILVRALDKHDYALYTLAITGINALVMLSNGGIIDAATAIGGRAWQDARHLGQVIASALSFRKRLAAMIVAPVIVFLAWLLIRNGAGIGELIALSVTAFLAAHFQLSTGILSVALRLRGMIGELQNLDLIGAAVRAGLVTPSSRSRSCWPARPPHISSRGAGWRGLSTTKPGRTRRCWRRSAP